MKGNSDTNKTLTRERKLMRNLIFLCEGLACVEIPALYSECTPIGKLRYEAKKPLGLPVMSISTGVIVDMTTCHCTSCFDPRITGGSFDMLYREAGRYQSSIALRVYVVWVSDR